MLSGKTMTILLLYEKSFYPEPDSHNRNRIKFELDLSNYETKYYKKNAMVFIHQNLQKWMT